MTGFVSSGNAGYCKLLDGHGSHACTELRTIIARSNRLSLLSWRSGCDGSKEYAHYGGGYEGILNRQPRHKTRYLDAEVSVESTSRPRWYLMKRKENPSFGQVAHSFAVGL